MGIFDTAGLALDTVRVEESKQLPTCVREQEIFSFSYSATVCLAQNLL